MKEIYFWAENCPFASFTLYPAFQTAFIQMSYNSIL
jgi:hypothetical protein